MNRGVLALFVRSMREENRRPLTYIIRFLLIAIVLLVVAANHRAFRFGGGAPGLVVFRLVTMLNLAFITIVGMGYFASAITEEKEDGTLGLLRMTNLNPLSILLGKSTSRLIGFLLLLLTQLPFISLAVSLGGVSLQQIFSCYLVLGTFTFLLANLALVFSVIFRRSNTAVAMTLTVLVATFWGVWYLGFLFQAWFNNDLGFKALADLIWACNPLASLIQIFTTGFDAELIIQPVSNVIAGVLCFLLSWALFDVFNQGEGRGATPGAASSRRRQPAATGNATRAAAAFSQKPRPGSLAVTWREFYFQGGGTKRLFLSCFFILGLGLLFIIVGSSAGHKHPDKEDVGGILITLGLLSATVRWGLEMATVFKHERQNQTWSSLSLLPKSIRRIAYEKVLASMLTVLPGLFVAAFGLMLLTDANDIRYFDDEVILGILYTFAWLAFGSHLIAYLSLYLKWGALPIGIVGCIVLQLFVLLLSVLGGVMGSPDEAIGLWCFGLLVGACFLHALIGRRLEVLAAED